jgi:hypothetical protein
LKLRDGLGRVALPGQHGCQSEARHGIVRDRIDGVPIERYVIVPISGLNVGNS